LADVASASRSTLARLLGWPVRRLLDPRARWMADLVDERVTERVEGLHRHLELLEQQHQGIREKIAAFRVEQLLADGPGRVEELTDEVGRFLNWAEGHEGYAAQAELWFNPPVALDYRTSGVRPRHVNERVVEQPFVFAALAGLEPGSRVLDVGGSESTVGLSLASIGHDVWVVDPRGYPLAHPRLHAAACRLDELDAELGEFDAAVVLSAVEHFGLGHYAGSGEAERLDIAALSELGRRVRPGGVLALTTPFGRAGVDAFERVYDSPGLDELLAGWEIVRATGAWRLDELTWVAGRLDEPRGERGVALVVARNPLAAVAVARTPVAAVGVARTPVAAVGVARTPVAPVGVARAPLAALDVGRVGMPYLPSARLDPDQLGRDPIAALGTWVAEAVADGLPSPNAMLLASVDPAGQPHARYVLLRGLAADGLRFFTNRESPKAEQLDSGRRAAATFGWHERHRQVRVTGRVDRLSQEDDDAYFATRDRATQIGSWASDQSRPVASREVLEDRVAEFTRRFAGRDVPRPPHWGGYVLAPETIEFWQGQPNRLHDRVRFTADGESGWRVERLYP
jgi:pyridoxamine 5'-phosphate oxidase